MMLWQISLLVLCAFASSNARDKAPAILVTNFFEQDTVTELSLGFTQKLLSRFSQSTNYRLMGQEQVIDVVQSRYLVNLDTDNLKSLISFPRYAAGML